MANNRLKPLREARGLSLAALAGLVGTSAQQVSHLELGKRQLTVEWLERLAVALECHPWEIVSALGPGDTREENLLVLFRRMSRADQDRILVEAAAKLRSKPPAKPPSR